MTSLKLQLLEEPSVLAGLVSLLELGADHVTCLIFLHGTRQEILYNSSASQKSESTSFRKISMIFTLFRMIFHVLNVSNYVEKTK